LPCPLCRTLPSEPVLPGSSSPAKLRLRFGAMPNLPPVPLGLAVTGPAMPKIPGVEEFALAGAKLHPGEGFYAKGKVYP
jgi:hypothetical protein